MFDRFTDRARKVMGLSRQEAQRFNHDYIGTEHILLGLVDEGCGVAADVLKNLDVDPKRIRREVERHITHGSTMVTMGQLPFTPRARKVLELALEEASNLDHSYIGTEHLLLGLIREEKGIAAQALHRLDVRFDDVREGIRELLGVAPDALAPGGDRFRLGSRPPRATPGLFDRFTARARKVMGRSWQEARRLGHDHIGTEHILLGLLDDDGVAGDVLKAMRVDPATARAEVAALLVAGPEPVPERQLPFTPRAKAVLELSAEESAELGHDYLGTEHLLLGLIREEQGIAAQVLHKMGMHVAGTRERIRELLGEAEISPVGDSSLTGRARRAMGFARAQAERLRHDGIGPEHILLGIAEEEASIGGELSNLLLRLVRTEARKLMKEGTDATKGRLPLSPGAVTVMELAREEAQALGHERIGTGHLIVGLLRENGIAAQALAAAGIRIEDAREDVRKRGGGTSLGRWSDEIGAAARRESPTAPEPGRQPLTPGLFGRFTDSNRKAMGLARQAAQRLNHDYIGTEHMLLGVIAATGAANDVLRKLGIDPARPREETEKRLTPGKKAVMTGQLPFTPAAKRALELALEEASALGSDSIREEHLLLGLVREGRGTAAQVLAALGVTADAVRREIAKAPGAPPE